MSEIEPTTDAGRRRRAVALTFFVISAVVTGAALVLLAAETALPDSMPAEALFLFMIPAYLFLFGWWFFGLLLAAGMLLLIRVPKPLPVAIFGVILMIAWGIAVSDLARLYNLG